MNTQVAADIETEWRRSPIYTMYDVSSHGKVRDHYTKEEIRQSQNARDFWQVNLRVDQWNRKVRNVHLLVADLFLPPRNPKHVVQFIDGDKSHIHVSNLRVVTRQEAQHTRQHNGMQINGHIVRIAETKETFRSISACARYLGVSNRVAKYALDNNGSIRGLHIEPGHIPEDEMRIGVVNDTNTFDSVEECAEFFDVEPSQVRHALKRSLPIVPGKYIEEIENDVVSFVKTEPDMTYEDAMADYDHAMDIDAGDGYEVADEDDEPYWAEEYEDYIDEDDDEEEEEEFNEEV